jgi:uroporphyrinogen-III synthase
LKTVLTTRPSSPDDAFTEALQSRGIRVLHLPMVEILPPEDWRLADEALDAVALYSGILLTSANAARFFLNRHAERGGDAQALPPVHAVGAKTAEAARAFGIDVRTVPEHADAMALAEALGETRNCYFLQPGSDIALPALRDEIARRGGRVHQIVVYRTVRPARGAVHTVDTLLIEGGIDAIAFFSPSAVRNFAALIPDFKQATVLIAVIGQTTAAAVAGSGLRVDLISPEATAEHFAAALADRLESEDRVELDPDMGWDLA